MKPNTEFVENMFSLMDTDHNGYISFREFLNAIIMLSKGTSSTYILYYNLCNNWWSAYKIHVYTQYDNKKNVQDTILAE